MSNYVRIAEENGDRYLNALEKGQESYLKYVAAINQWAPRAAGAYAGMSAMRAFSSASFEYSERLLEQQKAFAEKLFARAAMPVTAAPEAAKASSASTAKKASKARSSRSARSTAKPVKVAAARSSKKKAGKPAQVDKPVKS
jgi:hypothetical protein